MMVKVVPISSIGWHISIMLDNINQILRLQLIQASLTSTKVETRELGKKVFIQMDHFQIKVIKSK